MEHLTPLQAHAFLQQDSSALLIDCRSETEFFYVGHPYGAEHVAWQDGPDWARNPDFVDQVGQLARGQKQRPVLLICRSGLRSLEAGLALEAAGFTTVINVLEGFEGPLDATYHRSSSGGWRFYGLPWQQS